MSGADVLAEIFHDSDSGDGNDSSSDDDTGGSETESEDDGGVAGDEGDDEEEEVQPLPAKKLKGKAVSNKPAFIWKSEPVQPVEHPFTGQPEIYPDLLFQMNRRQSISLPYLCVMNLLKFLCVKQTVMQLNTLQVPRLVQIHVSTSGNLLLFQK